MFLDFFLLLIISLAFAGQKIKGMTQFSWTLVKDDDVQFLLYTRRNTDVYDQLRIDDIDSIINSHLDIFKEIKIIIHGWRNHGNSTLNRSIRNAYLTVSDVNVISVDWEQLSRKPYPVARLLVRNLGDKIARMVDFFVKLGVPLQNIHLIGHSLGAHIAGIAGQKILTGNLSRITGLDPAGPLFYSNNEGRLDESDAQFVDVIHTSGLCLGYFAPVGHVDFYPNRGIPVQPGCGLDVIGRCSHQRSYWLYAESILNERPFLATSCNSWSHYKHLDCDHEILMGEYVDRNARGKFYLRTNNIPPFALGNSSYYAKPPAIQEINTEIALIENVTSFDDFENHCECSNKNTAIVLKQMYKKVAWKKMRDKIDNWMKSHDCYCLLHNKAADPVSFTS
ncbi:pancreatic triacylglycerol lipase-like [Lycorma delicatula]|uniref:pancreatic triacylglycerol lipase-like n=1 Tax=Lycorma delicatula TaxID=130591 RepID=UPI003F50EE81